MQQPAAANPFLLKFDAIAEGTAHLEFQVDAAELDLSDAYFEFPGELRGALEIRRSLEMFALEGRFDCTIKGECSRCLKAVEQPLEAELKLLIQRRAASDEEMEAVAEEEDVEFFPPGTQEVDLSEQIRDALLLELPVRTYCKEDCKGLCSRCGHDLNEGPCSCDTEETDPRWEALKTLNFT